MDAEHKLRLEAILASAEMLVSNFYAGCNRERYMGGPGEPFQGRVTMRHDWHAFCEWAGVMREHIKVCRDALAQGIDFTEADVHRGQTLPVAPHHLAYLNEKIGCMFNGELQLTRLDAHCGT